MNRLVDVISRLFDLLAGAVGGSAPLLMLVVSVVTAVWALKLFQVVTPQARLAGVKDRLLGHIYEMGMYQGHLRVVGRIQGDLAKANLRYLSLTLPALVALTIPMVLTLGQLDSRFSHRPFAPGESTVLSIRLTETADLPLVRLDVPEGIAVTAGPVRDAVAGTASWRLEVLQAGRHTVNVMAADRTLGSRELAAAGELPPLGEASKPGWLHRVLYPGAPPLPTDGTLQAMTLELPRRQTRYLGLELDWLVAFMVISLLAGLALKDPLKVSI